MKDDFDSLLEGLGEPEPARTPPARSPSPPRALPWVIVGVVALLLVGGGIAFALLGQGESDAAAPGTSASASSSPSEPPSAEPSPEPEVPTPATVALPTTCRDLFSPAFHAQLASTGAVLSEGNTGPREAPFEQREVPGVVESTIAGAPHLECAWSFTDNYNIGIRTVVAEVTDDEAAQVSQALSGAGFTGVSELGSVRYIKEVAGSEGFGPHGYSIIARDGILIATEWIDWPASGYTADIVNTVLGAEK